MGIHLAACRFARLVPSDRNTRFTGTFQALHLASHGYIVVALEHPGTAFISAVPEGEGNDRPFTDHFGGLPNTFGAHNRAAIPIIRKQQADIEFVLARSVPLPGSPRIRPSPIG